MGKFLLEPDTPTPTQDIYTPGSVTAAERIQAISEDAYLLSGRSDVKGNLYGEVLQPYIDEVNKYTGSEFRNFADIYDQDINIIPKGYSDPMAGVVEYLYKRKEKPTEEDKKILSIFDDPKTTDEKFNDELDEFFAFVAKNTQLFPSDSKVLELNYLKLTDDVQNKANEVRARTQYVQERSEGLGDFALNLAGGIKGVATDPVNVAAMIATIPVSIGLGANMLNRLLIETTAAVGAEAFLQKEVQDLYKELGYEYTDQDYYDSLLYAGGGAILLGGAMEAILKAPGAAINTKKKLVTAYEKYQAKKVANQQGNPDLEKTIDNKDVDAFIAQEDLGVTIVYESVIDNDPNYIEFEGKVNKAKAAVLDDDLDKLPSDNIDEMKEVEVTRHDTMQLDVFAFDPDDIEIDAKAFQFKGGANELGELKTLEGVTEWNDTMSGQIILFERSDGTLVVADGHQRVNLAKRLKNDPNYKGKKPMLIARVLREKDGYTAPQIKSLAAATNIAQGTGTAIDAAEVFKVSPLEVIEMLPPRSKIVFHAKGLVLLEGQAFDVVKAGVVPEQYGAIVGRQIKGEKNQLAVLDLLQKLNPTNILEAEGIVSQAKVAGFKKVEQGGLFGDDEIADSLFSPRSKILSKTIQSLHSNKKLLTTLVDKSELIEQFGNKLNNLNNEQRKALNAQIIEIIKKNANTAGEIADELSNIARKFSRGEIGISEAVKQFTEAVQRSIDGGNYTRIPISGARVTDDVAQEINRASEPANTEGLDKFENADFGDKLDQEIEVLKEETEQLFDDLEEAGLDIKNEKLFNTEDMSGDVTKAQSFNQILDDIDADAEKIKKLKDC